MSAIYPVDFKTFTSRQNFTDVVDAVHMNEVQIEIRAIQVVLGKTPQAGFATVSSRLASVEGVSTGHIGAGDPHTAYLNNTRHDVTARHSAGSVVPVGSPGASAVGDVAAEGGSTTLARATHVHAREGFGAVTPNTTYSRTAANGTSATVARANHDHGMPAEPTTTDPMPAHLAATDPHTAYLLKAGGTLTGRLIAADASGGEIVVRIPNGKTSADGPLTYPMGVSTGSMSVANGWPFSGTVITVRSSDTGYHSQTLVERGGNGRFYWRGSLADETGWMAWTEAGSKILGVNNTSVVEVPGLLQQVDTRNQVLAYAGGKLSQVQDRNGTTVIKTTTLNYTGDLLTSTVEVVGGKTITTTMNYTGSDLTSVTRVVV